MGAGADYLPPQAFLLVSALLRCKARQLRRPALVKHPGSIDPAVLARHSDLAAEAAFRHVASLAAAAGVEVSFSQRSGRVAAEILAEARVVNAVLIVVAPVDRPGSATPYIGSHTRRVLEFPGVPVMVVPLRGAT